MLPCLFRTIPVNIQGPLACSLQSKMESLSSYYIHLCLCWLDSKNLGFNLPSSSSYALWYGNDCRWCHVGSLLLDCLRLRHSWQNLCLWPQHWEAQKLSWQEASKKSKTYQLGLQYEGSHHPAWRLIRWNYSDKDFTKSLEARPWDKEERREPKERSSTPNIVVNPSIWEKEDGRFDFISFKVGQRMRKIDALNPIYKVNNMIMRMVIQRGRVNKSLLLLGILF